MLILIRGSLAATPPSLAEMFVFTLPLTAAMSSTVTARAALLAVISPLDRGFKADQQQRRAVEVAIKELAASTSLQSVPDISGDWELIYTDAPDILGLDVQAGPLATCTRIGQQISEADGKAARSEWQPARSHQSDHSLPPEACPLAQGHPLGPRGRALAADAEEAAAALWSLLKATNVTAPQCDH